MDTSDSRTSIEALEERIEVLRESVESCRKAIIVSRAAVLGGFLLLGYALFARGAPVSSFVLAVAACLGGFVGMGSNATTRAQALDEIARCTAERNALIDAMAMRPWSAHSP